MNNTNNMNSPDYFTFNITYKYVNGKNKKYKL